METPGDMSEVRQRLVQAWGIRPAGLEALGREAIVEKLAQRVAHMLRHDLDRLMSALYILDVPEEKFSDAIQRPTHERPERALAELILARELERMHTWRRYAKPAIEDENAARFDDWQKRDRDSNSGGL